MALKKTGIQRSVFQASEITSLVDSLCACAWTPGFLLHNACVGGPIRGYYCSSAPPSRKDESVVLGEGIGGRKKQAYCIFEGANNWSNTFKATQEKEIKEG